MKRFTLFVLTWCALAAPVFAGPGHDHGNEGAAAPAGTPSPRFEAHSDLFEAVGILEAKEFAVFVDRFADNAPVRRAKVELESGAFKAVGQYRDDIGDYLFPSAAFSKPGAYPITLTITAGDDVDILAGNLVMPDPHAGHNHSHGIGAWWVWGIGFAALVALSLSAYLRVRSRRVGYGA
jgi:hypothetical protein